MVFAENDLMNINLFEFRPFKRVEHVHESAINLGKTSSKNMSLDIIIWRWWVEHA